MKKLIEGDMYGGTVSSYYKDNSSSTSIANLPKITETINNGVSILCFFGHSSVGLFDYTLDDPKITIMPVNFLFTFARLLFWQYLFFQHRNQ